MSASWWSDDDPVRFAPGLGHRGSQAQRSAILSAWELVDTRWGLPTRSHVAAVLAGQAEPATLRHSDSDLDIDWPLFSDSSSAVRRLVDGSIEISRLLEVSVPLYRLPRLPALQFDTRGRPHPVVPELLERTAGRWSREALALWLAAPNGWLPHTSTPADLLGSAPAQVQWALDNALQSSV